MATGADTTLDKISTREILEKLKKADGDNTEFFYLYVSTGGKERKNQKRSQSPVQQMSMPVEHAEDEDSTSDDTDLESEDEQNGVDDITENISQQTPSLDEEIAQNVLLSKNKARSEAMNNIHKVVLPKLLSGDGWRKVYDKDMKLIYRALYFNTIPRNQDEDENAYIQRVGNIRKMLDKEASKVKKECNVNFKINSLLSKPFLYDEQALLEQSVREGSAPKPPKQKRIDE